MADAKKPPRVSLTKTLRLLLDDDEETWALARLVEEHPEIEGIGTRIRMALNFLRRAAIDNVMAKELLDRVDGKLAPATVIPDDDGPARIVQPVLYVAPERPELVTGLFEMGEVAPRPKVN